METLTKFVLSFSTLLTTAFLIQPYRPVIVTGPSMQPTFSDGQLVFARPMTRAPRDGDVVLLQKDGATLIKRVTMVPGDRYEEFYLARAHQWVRVTTPAMKRLITKGDDPGRVRCIPHGQIFVSGDNSAVSIDSRTFGLVPISSIRGLVQSSTGS